MSRLRFFYFFKAILFRVVYVVSVLDESWVVILFLNCDFIRVEVGEGYMGIRYISFFVFVYL